MDSINQSKNNSINQTSYSRRIGAAQERLVVLFVGALLGSLVRVVLFVRAFLGSFL